MTEDDIKKKVDSLPISEERKVVVAAVETHVSEEKQSLSNWVDLKLIGIIGTVVLAYADIRHGLATANNGIENLQASADKEQTETKNRIAEWTKWRVNIEMEVAANTRDRFTGANWNSAVSIGVQRNPGLWGLPYLWEIK